MSLQSDFEAAGVEYAQRRAAQLEAERLAALSLDAQRANNAEAFASAIETALDGTEPPTDATEDPDTTASDLMAAIAADTNKETA